MTSRKRFLLGGGGALMPVLVSLLAIDIGATLGSEANLNTGNIIGLAVRYLILFIVGGVVAYLHDDEHKSFKLFELGIAAPALITSLVTAQGVAVSIKQPESDRTSFNISLVSSAYAGTSHKVYKEMTVAGLFSDIMDGASGKAYRNNTKPVEKEASATTWETCNPPMCSQTVVAFSNYDECSKYQKYRGSDFRACVKSDKVSTDEWETCNPPMCSQTVATFKSLKECQAYEIDHANHKKCTRPGGQ